MAVYEFFLCILSAQNDLTFKKKNKNKSTKYVQ